MALAMAFTKECAYFSFIYILVYKAVFLDAVSGTLYIILQKIKLNQAQCPENVSTPLNNCSRGLKIKNNKTKRK